MGDWSAGEWLLMGAGMLLFWALLIGGVIWLVTSLGRGGAVQRMSAREVLERRLAEGEISVEEFRERRGALDSESDRGQ